jgi:multidrug efflux system membrane fusion protein
MRRRTFFSAGIGAAALAAAAVGLSVGLPTGAKEATAETAPRKTAKITKQNLADTETKSGTLGYGNTTKLANKVNGTMTWVPTAGATVERGATVYKVDDLPVVLMYGALPFYRPLSSGTEGADVDQFTANLKALGYSGFSTSAIKKWQKALGLQQTGVVEPGRIAVAAEAMRIATVQAVVGDEASPGREVLSYTATKRQIITTIEVNDSRLVKVNEKVKVTLPDNKVVEGAIVSSRTVIQNEQNGDATTRIEVTIGLADAKVDFDQASVKIAFTASTRQNVLTVPVAALLALREGGYGVEIIEGTSSRIVAVDTGMFAAGRVEVSGAGLSDGLTVGMPS